MVLVAAIVFGLSFGSFGVKNVKASDYYDQNKDLVELIDEGAVYFKMLDDAGDVENMEAIVYVSSLIKLLTLLYSEKDYFASDWEKITKEFNLCKNYFKVSGDASDGNNYYLNYKNTPRETIVDKITAYSDNINKIKTKRERFNTYLNENVEYLDDKKTEMLKTNAINPGVAPDQKVGIYDDEAIAELEAIVAEGQAALGEVTATVVDGSIDYTASCAEADEVKAVYVKKLLDVCRNDVERAISAINDYKAIESGAKEGDADEAKERALAAIEAGKEFLDGASDEVKDYYKQSWTDMAVFEEGGEPEDLSDLDDKATLESEDGVISIKAMVDDVEVDIFPHDASVKINDNTGSVYSLNLDNAIAKDDRGISVAYCMDIDIYAGSTLWEQKTEYDGKEITYVVSVDLSKYYSERVKNKESWFTGVLDKIGIKTEAPEDPMEAIAKCNDRISSGESEGSLCYHYAGKGVVDKLEASIDGSVITFKTKSFSNFAVTKAGGRSVLYNPLFWLIFLLAIIVCFVIVVIIMKCIRYTITFDSNGGSEVAPVKAKKDEYFILPASPTKRGSTFGGWYEDKALTVRFIDTSMVKRRSFTVYAKWNEALSVEQAKEYFCALREKLASVAEIGDSYEIEKDAKIRLAKLVDDEVEVKLYLALDADAVLADNSYNIRAVEGEDFAETPLLINIDSRDAYDDALELIDILVAQYGLKETEPVIEDEDADVFLLELCGEDYVAEEEPEAVEEEPAEEAEESEEAEEAEEEGASEEELRNYYNEIRTYVKGFALEEDKEGLDKDATILRVFLREETVDVYLKIDAEKVGAEAAEGILAAETPALIKVCCDETFEAAKTAIKTMMDEIGLVETGESVDLGDSEAKSFGYKLKFEE